MIPDHSNSGETDAIEMATRFCESHGIESTLVIPGDIPLIQASELEQILDAAPGEGSVLVPAADGRGTNAIFRRPAGLFPLRFGNDSFKPHLAAAQRDRQSPASCFRCPGSPSTSTIPPTCMHLADAPGETRSQRLIRQWDLSDLPLAANE